MDIDAVQVDTWVTLAEAASLLSKSEKTLRRWIAAGDLDTEAVHREETVGGFRYMLRRADVEKLAGAKARPNAGDLDSMGAALPTLLDSRLERIASLLQEHSAQVSQQTAGHVQAIGEALTARLDQVDSNAVQAKQDQAAALGALRELVELQAAEVRELRAELREERERRGWWRWLFGSRGGADGG